MAYQLNSKPLAVDVAFKTSDGTQYPSNWLRLSSADEKKAIGITEVAEPTSYDRRFYSAVDKPRDLAELKTLWVSKQKEEAGIFYLNTTGTLYAKPRRQQQFQPQLQLIGMELEQIAKQGKMKSQLAQM